MSHHSDKPIDDEEMKKFKESVAYNPFGNIPELIEAGSFNKDEKEIEPGATGKFPDGKLGPEDKGEIAIKIGTKDGRVIMDFGEKPINWIGLTPEEALALGKFLFEKADLIKYGS